MLSFDHSAEKIPIEPDLDKASGGIVYMLQIERLTFGYLKKSLLKDVNLSIKRGDTVSIVGPSGSGKTTFFRLISGLAIPKSGLISLSDKIEVKQRSPLISYMMQEDLLLPWKTLIDNLMVVFDLENSFWCSRFLKSYKSRKEIFRKKALQIIEDVGLSGFENYYPMELSGGMRQRASLARSLLFKRPLLLLDEPFGAIDVFKRKDLYSLLNKIKEKYQLTILFITHDLNDAFYLSNHIYLLDDGVLKRYSKEHAI